MYSSSSRVDGKSSDELKGPEALKTIITEGSSFFNNVKMTLEVGPIVNENYISARWNFFGIYKSGMPGAKALISQKLSYRKSKLLKMILGSINLISR